MLVHGVCCCCIWFACSLCCYGARVFFGLFIVDCVCMTGKSIWMGGCCMIDTTRTWNNTHKHKQTINNNNKVNKKTTYTQTPTTHNNYTFRQPSKQADIKHPPKSNTTWMYTWFWYDLFMLLLFIMLVLRVCLFV